MTNAQLDLAELEALLNDDSDGQRFANFLQKKQGKVRQHRRVFGELDAPRLSLKVRVQKVQKSSDVENQQNQEDILDKRSPQLEVNAEDNVVASSRPIANNGTFQKDANNTTPDRIKSPLLRLSALKSGGGVSDRLRRYSLKRALGITPKRRTLLKEFESTLDAADFLPPISSTPNTIHATEANASFRSERVETNILDPNENTLKNDSPNELNSSKRDTQSELLSLQRKDAELLQILEETMKRAEQHNNKNLSCFECTPNAAPSPNSSRRRTYTLEKGEQLGQIVLTPKKVSSPRQTLQQELQQPTQEQNTTTAQVQKIQKLFQTSLNSTQSTPLKHTVIPETQELPKQAEEVITTFQKSNPNTTMVVIPLYQTFNNGAATPNANENSLNSKELPEMTHSQPKNSNINKTTEPNKETDSIPVQAESTQRCDNDIDNLRLSDILTDDEDLPRQSQNSIGPINLAAPLSNSTQRIRRLRKRSTTRKKLQMENTLVYSTETENGNPGKGYPLNLRRKVSERETETKRKSRNVQLNKPPSNPINGEAFALELERMSYNEILDLRKRNSLGKVFCINGRRSSKQLEKVCKKQQTLEEEIQSELLKRKSASHTVGQIPIDDSPTTPTENNGVVCENVSLPQAPVGFQDSSIQRIPAEALIRNEEFDSDVTYSSPVDKTLPARISYVPTSKRISDESVKVQQKKRKRGNDVPEVLQNYMEVSRKIKKTSNKLHKSKRSLYSKGNSDSESNAANSSLEKEFGDVQSFPIVPPPPRSSATENECNEIRPVSPPPSFSLMETAICSQLQTDAIISTSPASPPPPPPLYANNSADAEVLNPQIFNTIESDKRNDTTVNKTANDKPNNEANYSAKADKATINEETLFKKPVGSAPKKGRRGQNNKLQNSQKNSTKLAAQHTISESISVENHSIDDGGVRRSKRGQVPIKQNSARSYIQMMYEEVIKKSQTSKKKRLDSIKKQQKQSEDSKLNEEPIASSTAHSYTAAKSKHIKLNKKNVKKKKDYSMLGDTNCTAGSTINNANKRSPPMATVHEATNEDGFTNNVDAQEHDLEILQTKEKKTKRKYVKKKNLGLEQNLGDASKLIPAPIDELNSIFDQLKNASNVEQQQLSEHKPKTVSSNNTTRNLRIRLKRCELLPSKSVHESVHTKTKENYNSSKQTERPPNNFSNEVSCSSSNYEQENTESSEHSVNKSGELLTWLKTVCDNPSWSVRSQELFTEMRISTAGNLIFNNLDGIDYAFYDTEHKGSLGYLRFKPRQIKPSKRAKQFHLHFIVLAGEFKFGTNCEHGTFRDGDMVAINKGVRYSIENSTDDIGLLMVIKK